MLHASLPFHLRVKTNSVPRKLCSFPQCEIMYVVFELFYHIEVPAAEFVLQFNTQKMPNGVISSIYFGLKPWLIS